MGENLACRAGIGHGCRWERGRDGWLLAGHFLPSPPTPPPVPLELVLSAAPKGEWGGTGDGACESPEFHGNRKFCPCERKLWRRICERRGAHLSCQSPASLSVPPLPLPLLPFLRQRHGHRTCTDRARWKHRGHSALRRGGQAGLGWAGLPHPCSSSSSCSLRSSSVWRSRAALLGQERQREPQTARGKPRCRRMRAASPLWI